MTRRNLVLAITAESGLQQTQVKRIVQKIFDAIVDALIEDGRVELRNFGVFEVRYVRLIYLGKLPKREMQDTMSTML